VRNAYRANTNPNYKAPSKIGAFFVAASADDSQCNKGDKVKNYYEHLVHGNEGPDSYVEGISGNREHFAVNAVNPVFEADAH
jgi:hypothetical protein